MSSKKEKVVPSTKEDVIADVDRVFRRGQLCETVLAELESRALADLREPLIAEDHLEEESFGEAALAAGLAQVVGPSATTPTEGQP